MLNKQAGVRLTSLQIPAVESHIPRSSFGGVAICGHTGMFFHVLGKQLD